MGRKDLETGDGEMGGRGRGDGEMGILGDGENRRLGGLGHGEMGGRGG